MLLKPKARAATLVYHMPGHGTTPDAHIAYYGRDDADYAHAWWKGGSARPTMRGRIDAVRGISRRVLGAVPGSGLVTDTFEARRYAEQQGRLQGLGGVAAVDALLHEDPRKQRSKRDRVVSVLRQSRIIESGRVVGVQPVIYATAQRDHGRMLTSRARTLSRLIDADKVGGETLFNAHPILVHGQRGEASQALYGAIDEAATDLVEKDHELRGEQDVGSKLSPTLIVVMEAGHIARALQGPTYDDVARSGIATLSLIGRLPRDNIWVPGSLVPAVPARPRPESELPVPLAAVPNPEPSPQAAQPYTSVYF